jgi:DNA-binding NtrC family response regulator
MCDRDTVTAADLPTELRSISPPSADEQRDELVGPATLPLGASQLVGARRLAEQQAIVRALQLCSQNRSQAAKKLGISRAAFYKKLHQLGIA